MDRIGNSSPNPLNQCYEPNTCEPPPVPSPGAKASCPDGTVSADGVCASTGLKGPQTAAQRYVESLAAGTTEASSGVQAGSGAVPLSASASRESLKELMSDASAAAMDAVRSAIANGSLAAGQKLERELTLPNGCSAKFSITGSLQTDERGKPELVLAASGSVEGKLGAVSAEVQFSYSRSTSAQESVSFGACLFGGVDQDAAHWAELEAKAGVCATLKDGADAPATLEFEAVAKASAGFDLGGGLTWGIETEARTTLSKEELAYDFLR